MASYKQLVKKINEKQSLKSLQSLREEMWHEMAFDDETAEQTLLLMVEEVGELAKATRKQIGMKCDTSSGNYTNISEEVADVFSLLLDFCTVTGIDLFDAFKSKSEKNIGRVWKKMCSPDPHAHFNPPVSAEEPRMGS